MVFIVLRAGMNELEKKKETQIYYWCCFPSLLNEKAPICQFSFHCTFTVLPLPKRKINPQMLKYKSKNPMLISHLVN